MLISLSTIRVIVALAIPSYILAADSSSQCFFPDGSTASNDVPCSGSSVCCPEGDMCARNKLCAKKVQGGNPDLSRGSCLDKSFGSGCPTFCSGINDSGNVTVLPCGDSSLGAFCCDEGKGFQCCSTPSKVFTLEAVATPAVAGASGDARGSTKTSKRDKSTSKSTTIQVQTQTETEFETQTSIEVQTSIQVQTSAQIITSVQVQTSVQVITSVRVSTSTPVVVQTPPAPLPTTSTIPQIVPSQVSISSAIIPTTSIIPPILSSQVPISSSLISSSAIFVTSPVSTQPQQTTLVSTAISSQFGDRPSPQSTTSSTLKSTSAPTAEPVIVSSATAKNPITSLSTSSPNSQNSSSGDPSLGTTIGGVVGGAAAIAVLGILWIFVYRNRRRAEGRRWEQSIGRSNFADEKGNGSMRSGRGGTELLGRIRSGASGGSIRSARSGRPKISEPISIASQRGSVGSMESMRSDISSRDMVGNRAVVNTQSQNAGENGQQNVPQRPAESLNFGLAPPQMGINNPSRGSAATTQTVESGVFGRSQGLRGSNEIGESGVYGNDMVVGSLDSGLHRIPIGFEQESPSRMMTPAVSGEDVGRATTGSDTSTYRRLLYDVQSEPF